MPFVRKIGRWLLNTLGLVVFITLTCFAYSFLNTNETIGKLCSALTAGDSVQLVYVGAKVGGLSLSRREESDFSYLTVYSHKNVGRCVCTVKTTADMVASADYSCLN